ncbi:MAG: XRE family transcriptional regulator [Christensenellaceae bacterium]|nr:XRE family transcriptional regulator [Christensenellaceae bacterium]
MSEMLKEIAQRMKALRVLEEYSAEELAEKCDLSLAEYEAYEAGKRDFSFSFVYTVAGVLGVDVIDILTGESPKLSGAAVVRRGQGLKINRRDAYDYRHLAHTFRNKIGEPFLVTVEPAPESEKPALHEHGGQEFNYMLEGTMALYIGEVIYVLEAGDSIYFDSGVPHAMRAMNGKSAQFLAVVMGQPNA